MKINNVFDAVRDGTFEDFKYYLKRDNIGIDVVEKHTGMNLLCLTVINDTNYEDKIKIVKYLISEGIDVNFICSKDKMNALHTLHYCNRRSNIEYLIEVTKLLIGNGIDVNAKDKYGAVPLKYAVTLKN